MKGAKENAYNIGWKGMEFQVKEDGNDLIQRSYIGKIYDTCTIKAIWESFTLNGFSFIQL